MPALLAASPRRSCRWRGGHRCPCSSFLAQAGGRLGDRDLFVKRVAAVGGDVVELTPSGGLRVNGALRPRPPLACAEEPLQSPAAEAAAAGAEGVSARTIPPDSLFVLGDCEARSTDSRSWGPLPVANVVARPVVRIWPLGRQGAIVDEVDLNPFVRVSKK